MVTGVDDPGVGRPPKTNPDPTATTIPDANSANSRPAGTVSGTSDDSVTMPEVNEGLIVGLLDNVPV